MSRSGGWKWIFWVSQHRWEVGRLCFEGQVGTDGLFPEPQVRNSQVWFVSTGGAPDGLCPQIQVRNTRVVSQAADENDGV